MRIGESKGQKESGPWNYVRAHRSLPEMKPHPIVVDPRAWTPTGPRPRPGNRASPEGGARARSRSCPRVGGFAAESQKPLRRIFSLISCRIITQDDRERWRLILRETHKLCICNNNTRKMVYLCIAQNTMLSPKGPRERL